MNNQGNLLTVTPSPHLHSSNSIPAAMRDVIIALIPAFIASVYFFRISAVLVVVTCIVTAVVCEMAAQKLMKREVTVNDYSAVITGLLLALTLPATVPLWVAAIGAAVAIIIGKQLFGGLGNNIFNPALIGRAFLLASWPVATTGWVTPIDGVSTATPLGIIKESLGSELPNLTDMFIGNIAGCLGETSALALLLGALYLIYKKHIDWRIPTGYLATVFAITAVVGMTKGQGLSYPVFHLFAGGLMLGAFFMATDWVTTPVTKKGRVVFGIGCGLITVLIRLKGGYPEGVCYSILLMNTLAPLIDRYTKDRVFGGGKSHA